MGYDSLLRWSAYVSEIALEGKRKQIEEAQKILQRKESEGALYELSVLRKSFVLEQLKNGDVEEIYSGMELRGKRQWFD